MQELFSSKKCSQKLNVDFSLNAVEKQVKAGKQASATEIFTKLLK